MSEEKKKHLKIIGISLILIGALQLAVYHEGKENGEQQLQKIEQRKKEEEKTSGGGIFLHQPETADF